MEFYLTLTSQGQISIPAKVRKELGIKKNSKLLMTYDGNQLNIKTAPDVLHDFGKLQYTSDNKKNFKNILKDEKKAIEDGILEDLLHKQKKK